MKNENLSDIFGSPEGWTAVDDEAQRLKWKKIENDADVVRARRIKSGLPCPDCAKAGLPCDSGDGCEYIAHCDSAGM